MNIPPSLRFAAFALLVALVLPENGRADTPIDQITGQSICCGHLSQRNQPSSASGDMVFLDDFTVGDQPLQLGTVETMFIGYDGFTTFNVVQSWYVAIHSSPSAALSNLDGDVIHAVVAAGSPNVTVTLGAAGPNSALVSIDLTSLGLRSLNTNTTYYVSVSARHDFSPNGGAFAVMSTSGGTPGGGNAYHVGRGAVTATNNNAAYRLTANAGCASSLGVARLSQGDPRWGKATYDHTKETIGAKGCGLTSLTMAMNFAGLSSVTPGTLNNAANALANGYTPNGGVNWGPMTSTGSLGFAARKINSLVSPQSANDYLDEVLCKLRLPVIIGVFKSPVTGVACPEVCHFVLVTGRRSDGQYLIADPGKASNTTLDAYDNKFETRGYVVPNGQRTIKSSQAVLATSVVQQLSVAAGGQANLLVRDPAGHTTGIDSISAERKEEIPRSAHFIDSLSDDETGEATDEVTQSVYVEQPLTGNYEIRVTPYEDGPFRISATTLAADGTLGTLLSIDGTGVSGQTQVYFVSVGSSSQLGNISTRLQVGKDDDALFEGFIIQGPAGSTKKMIARGVGPFLGGFGIADPLADPSLDIFAGNTKVATNNDWRVTLIGGLIAVDQSEEIAASGFAPANELESAIIVDLAPGGYTAIVRGLGNTTGIGLVDAFDLNASSSAKLVNFSTRGVVQPGDKLLTAGFIIQSGPVRSVIRATGPSLAAFGIMNALPDTTLQLRNQNGDVVQENDDWETNQRQELLDTGLQPSDPREAALICTIQPGQYTAQVRGKPETTGIGVVEVYFLQ